MDIPNSGHAADPDSALRARTRALLDADLDGRKISEDIRSEFARICRAATEEMNLLGAVITVQTPAGAQAVAAASDTASERLEEIQFAVGEGPGHEAFLAGRPILIPDLTSAFGRWPGYVPQAVRAGVGAVFVFPIQLGAARLGVLTLYRDRPRSLTSTETSQALIFAELAIELLTDGPGTDSSGMPRADLLETLHLRHHIFQAQGMVKVQLNVSLVEALARMRAHAFATTQDLNTVALAILAGTTQLPRDDQ